jgi:putative SOS response-associated peptidase YedK
MPVILRDEDYDLWLDPGYQHGEGILEMLRPYDASAMKRYPVSKRVNSVNNEDAECAAEVNLQGAPATTLFPM